MSTITLTPASLAQIANLAAFAASDAVTPVLTGIAVSVAGGEVRAVATDRYAVARYVGQAPEFEELPQTVLPTAFLTTVAKAARGAFQVHLTVDGSTVTADWGDGSVSASVIEGNYPPVDRLMTDHADDIPASMTLSPTLLARLAKLRGPGAGIKGIVNFALSADGTNLRADGGPYSVRICPIRTR